MISGSGTIGVSLSGHGLAVDDNSRTPRLFKIVSGTNPYTASEVVLNESDASRMPTGIYAVTAAQKVLHEVNAVATVKADTVVEATPNPSGLGFTFTAPSGSGCGLPFVYKVQVGTSVAKSAGNVTDVYVRYRHVTVDANGCVSISAPMCETAATAACSTSESTNYYCIGGVCWKYYDGIVPGSYDAGPFASSALCDAGCPASVPSCTDVDPGTLPASLTLTVTNDSACPAPCTQTAGNGGFGGTLDTVGAETWSAVDDSGCGLENTLTFNCQSDEYKLTVSNVWSGNPDYPTDKIYSAVSGTLVPFSLTFEIDGSYICGPDGAGNTITIVVTE